MTSKFETAECIEVNLKTSLPKVKSPTENFAGRIRPLHPSYNSLKKNFPFLQRFNLFTHALGLRIQTCKPLTMLCLRGKFPVSSRFSSKVARRPWAPRTFLDFAIKTGYVFDYWKTFCCPWVFCGVFSGSWTVVKLFITELLITVNIQESKLNNVIEQNNV